MRKRDLKALLSNIQRNHQILHTDTQSEALGELLTQSMQKAEDSLKEALYLVKMEKEEKDFQLGLALAHLTQKELRTFFEDVEE